MAEKTHNIVVLGGSYGGLGTSHGILKQLSSLESQTNKKYKITMLSNSTKFWFSVGAPRAMLRPYPNSNDDSFLPIKDGFAQYPSEKFEFIHAEIVGLDPSKKQVSYKLKNNNEEVVGGTSQIGYDTAVVATGSSGDDPLYGLQGGHIPTYNAYLDVQNRIKNAKSVLVVGGGSAGTETAGELGELYGKNSDSPKDITILSGNSRLLTSLRPAIGARAEEMLSGQGVKTIHDQRLKDRQRLPDGGEQVTLSDGSKHTFDLVLVATGRRPNAPFVPSSFLTERGQVKVDPYLRVENAEGLYATGDIASVSSLTLVAMLTLVPTTINNIVADLGGKGKAKEWKPMTEKEMQIVPVGPHGGVGAAFGWWLPSFAVKFIKAKDFMFSKAKDHVQGKAM